MRSHTSILGTVIAAALSRRRFSLEPRPPRVL